MGKARRMALVSEEDIFKTEERKVNTSPLVKSLANMDLEIKAILEDTSMPPDRKIQLYDSIMSRYRNILNQSFIHSFIHSFGRPRPSPRYASPKNTISE